jgi:predicted pyridoxine 5'-phosphate oxidase superfamily flavin-nucleotide-binding protein
MGNRFSEIAFTPAVRAEQEAHGSRRAYAAQADLPARDERLGDDEVAFIGARDSFYLASVGETGWPYVQHRGGPPGFLRVLDDHTLGFADFSGNRQYISVGNVDGDARVCLFLMDYPEQTRLKILGRARLTEDPEIVERLAVPGYPAKIERAWLIDVAGFDWNCHKHITPRFSEAEVIRVVAPLQARIRELEARLAKDGGSFS